MAETIIEHVYHLKGGVQAALEYENPKLDRREPIVVFCNDGNTRLKIGDGKRHYNDLPFIGGDLSSVKIVVDSKLDEESSNPVMNKVVTRELYNKVDKVPGMGLSQNNYTNSDKQKLFSMQEGATRVFVDNTNLNAESTNAISNSLVTRVVNDMKASIDHIDESLEQVVDDKVVETVEKHLQADTTVIDGGQI